LVRLGLLSNNEDFAKDFNCPIGSIMIQEEKCSGFILLGHDFSPTTKTLGEISILDSEAR
jgi:hypothetical protein